MLNIFKVNNKETRSTSLTLTSCSSVSIVNFEAGKWRLGICLYTFNPLTHFLGFFFTYYSVRVLSWFPRVIKCFNWIVVGAMWCCSLQLNVSFYSDCFQLSTVESWPVVRNLVERVSTCMKNKIELILLFLNQGMILTLLRDILM